MFRQDRWMVAARAEADMAKKKQKEHKDGGLMVEPTQLPRQTLFGWLRGRFFAGIVIAAPIAISIGIVSWLIGEIDKRVKPLLPPILDPETYTNIAIPGVGVLVAIILLTLLGAVATNLIGRAALRLSDRILSRIPVVSNIYNAFKQLFELLASSDQNNFQEVVLVEYPKKGTWCIGFLTAKAKGELRTNLSDEHIGVFVPTTPNPTSGFLMYLHQSEVIRLEMSVEEGARMIISAGLVVPEQMPMEESEREKLTPPEASSEVPSAETASGPSSEPARADP
ncbi:MAG: DUF502 domain-containing protein [Pseudomonadota bacterium]